METYSLETFGQILEEARRGAGLSQAELARRSGVSQPRISNIERGSKDYRVSTLIALCRAIQLEPVLVPRATLPAVRSVLGESTGVEAEFRAKYSLEADD